MRRENTVMRSGKKSKVANDFVYTVMANIMMNAVLQILIYPMITRFRGEDVTGNILYFIGIIYIVPQALGTTLNNVRLMMRKQHDVTNQDFRLITIVLSTISALICGFVSFVENRNHIFAVAYGVFSVIFLLRIYAAVEFRLTLRFKEYFKYFCLICVGYVIGFAFYLVTDIWLLIFIVGEAMALTYSCLRGNIFKSDGRTNYSTHIYKTVIIVLLSTLVRDCVNQFDKVILKQSISASVVTEYHVVSLIAKTMLMLVQPINSLILTYLTMKDSDFSKKQLAKFTGITLGFGLAFYGFCVLGTPIFIKVLYPDLYADVMPYNLLVNLGLVIGFLSTMYMSILLSQGKTGIQMTIQSIWGIAYIILGYYFVTEYQIWGLAYVTLGANLLKLIFAILFVFYEGKKNKDGDSRANEKELTC